MASYPPPNEKYKNLYNSQYFTTKEQYAVSEGIEDSFSDDFLRKDGTGIMTGHLTTPSIVLFNDGTIQFSDATIQDTAFTPVDRLNTSANAEKLTKQTYDSNTDTTRIAGSFKIKKIIFEDDNNKEQVIAFSQNDKDKIVTNETKLTNVSYDSQQNKTTINNATHINSLTCGNISTSHLSGTTSNVQQQINSITADGITEEERDKINLLNITSDTLFVDKLQFEKQGIVTVQNSAFTDELKERVELLDITPTSLYIHNRIDFVNSGYAVSQNFAFTDTLKTKLESDTLINSGNKLNASLIANGTISNTEFQYLDGVTSNIQEQINTLKNATSLTNINSVSIVPFGLDTQGQWYQGTYSRILMSFLQSGLHSFNLTITVSNVNELQKMLSKIQIKSISGLVDESLYCGINLDSSTSNQKTFHTNLQYMYYIPPSLHEQLCVSVFTDYHYKANSGFTANCKCQFAKLT